MGWDFTQGASKKNIIDQIIRSSGGGGHCIAHCVRGNCLWTVFEESEGEPDTRLRQIVLFLLGASKGDWGYKDMTESMHPYYYSCPLKYLDMVKQPTGEDSARWRENVRALAARKAVKLAVGSKVKLIPNCRVAGDPVEMVTIVSVKPLRAVCAPNGMPVNLRRRHIAEVIA